MRQPDVRDEPPEDNSQIHGIYGQGLFRNAQMPLLRKSDEPEIRTLTITSGFSMQKRSMLSGHS